jgi:hypothetical protein
MTNPFKGLYTKLRSALSGFLHGPGGALLAAATESIVREAGAVGCALLLAEAQKRVAALDTVPLSGHLKAVGAQQYLIEYALRVGIPASQSLVNYAVEVAVRALRNQQGVK